MKIGTVVDTVQVRRATPCLGQQRFLTVRADGCQLVAADLAGAGRGDRVLLVTGSAAAGIAMEAPVDAAIVAVLEDA